jgi:DNA-directed RNA polymerase
MVVLKLLKLKLKIYSIKEKINYLAPGYKLENLISSSNSNSIFSLPPNLPMIVKPGLHLYKGKMVESQESDGIYDSNDGNFQLGGYLLNGIEYTDNLITNNWELSSTNKFKNNNSILNMVNRVNSVQFKINNNVLDFILANNHLFNFYTDPNYIHPLSLKSSKLTKAEALELEQFYSKRYTEQNIIGSALLYSTVPTFYLPVRLDYRGRLYCIVEYLNYQGIELAKSLLEFSEGEKVELSDKNSIDYLKIFGANCYGNKLDKTSFNNRIN